MKILNLKKCISHVLRMCKLWLILTCWILVFAGFVNPQTEPKTVSQCFTENGFSSFVSLYCGANQVIQIEQAIHGTHKNPDIDHCGKLENDCITDTTSKYDWTRCEGRHSCVQQVQYMDIEGCQQDPVFQVKDDTEDSKRTTVQYLQVQYNCIQSTTEKAAVTQIDQAKKRTRPLSKSVPTLEICNNFTRQEYSAVLQNPGFPNYYTTSSDCRCVIQAQENSKVAVTFHDLSLVMRGKLCVDWLLLQSPNYKDSTIVACGLLKGQMRTLESKSNWLLLHFHTATQNGMEGAETQTDLENQRPMAGFKIEMQSTQRKPLNIKCYKLDPNHIDNDAYRNGEDDSSSGLVLPASNWDEITSPGPLTSSASETLNTDKALMCAMLAFSSWTIMMRGLGLHTS